MVGQTLAHYKIREKIGSGGMGEVYRAEDTKLDREVALKVLPPELAESEERRSRFQREAKAIAALNHPNIVQIYSVEEADGIHFITLELVKGKTLAELLPEQGFPLRELFDIAIPLSDAVAAAHRQGILHRDLKPQNIIVSDEGRIKVVDFGLAKWTSTLGEEGSELPTVEKTTAGVIMGTLPYMSPEQAEAKSIDARSDVFSMGVVLYEMLTGRRPFGGDTPARVQASILRDEPPAIARGPEPLGKLLEKCLAKEPSRRPQSALEVRNGLEAIRDDWRSGELQAPIGAGSSVNRWWSALVLTALVLVVLGIAFRPGRDADQVLRFVNPVQVTSAMGVEDDPTWSPDGGQLAYSSDRSGNPDIWVKHVERGEPVNRTADYEGLDCCPSWSPDGSELGFWSDRDGGGYFVMSAVGGAARKVINAKRLRESSHFNAPQWSPDGSELAGMIVEDGKFFLEIQPTDRRQARRIPLPGAGGARNDVTWSRDGRWFAFVDGGYFRDNLQLWLLRQEDGAAFAVTDGLTRVLSPSFSRDGRSLYYVSNRTGSMDLWQQKLGADGVLEGDPIPLTVGIGMRSAVLSPDGTKLAYSKGRLVANLWRVPVLENRSAVWADAEQLTFDEALVEFFDVSTDGRRLVFNSDRTGNMDLWVMPAEGGALSALTSGPELDWHPQWSPSGDEVAFYSLRSGRREIHVLPLD
ncbi:MAG TPA: protein kinase, partial [Vicinamibacteria bacterium]|nr:protein kinase [Vicinamibacteria bacterium]